MYDILHTDVDVDDDVADADADDDDDDDDDVYVDHTTIIIVSSVVGAVALIAIICALQFIRQVQVCVIVRDVSRLIFGLWLTLSTLNILFT